MAPGRRYRVDFAWPDPRPGMGLAVEVEGGTWVQGSHARGSGIETDCEKSALLAIEGYRLIRVSGNQVRDGRAVGWIERVLRPVGPTSGQ